MIDGRRGEESSRPNDRAQAGLDQVLAKFKELHQKTDTLSRLVEDLRGRDEILTGAVAALRTDVDAMAATVTAVQPRVWWWPDLRTEGARVAWETLTVWMQNVLVVRYPEVDRVLQPCWYRHPDALDALTSLYATWRWAYHEPTAQPPAAASWLNQWLPAATEQIKHALRSCDWTAHRDDATRREHIGRLFGDDLARFIAADISARGDTPA